MLTEKAQITSTAWLTNAPTPFLQQVVEDYPNPVPNEKQLSRRLRQEPHLDAATCRSNVQTSSFIPHLTHRRFRAVRTGGSSADDPDARNARTGRGLARTADGELKRGLARTRADSRGLARTRADSRTRGASHTTTTFW